MNFFKNFKGWIDPPTGSKKTLTGGRIIDFFLQKLPNSNFCLPPCQHACLPACLPACQSVCLTTVAKLEAKGSSTWPLFTLQYQTHCCDVPFGVSMSVYLLCLVFPFIFNQAGLCPSSCSINLPYQHFR